MMTAPESLQPQRLAPYRVLFLNTADHVCAAANIACADDAAALREAEQMLKWHAGVEVWQAERVVGTIGRRTPDR